MQQVFNPLVNMYQSQLETSRRLADALFSGTQKIDHIVIGATHRAFTEQLNLVEAMAAARDPRTAGATLQSNFLSGGPNEAMNYQREIIKVFTEMQNEIGRSLHDYMEQLGGQSASGTAKAAGMAREQVSSPAFNPVTSMFSVWESAFKEVAALARKNMTTAQSAARDTMERSMQSASNYADVAADAVRTGAGTVEAAANATAHATRSAAAVDEGGDEKRGSHAGGKRK